ncbi:MAG: hypothetical protein R3B96_23560 [Pirellulaceae bacterium]|nr:hypothetical protein [Planctomycetales bacterium]
MTQGETEHRLTRFFAGVTEYTFESQLGVPDPELIDYVSTLLIRFLRNDQAVPRSVVGKPLLELPEMVEEAGHRLGEAQRKIHRQIGDFTLFWAGMFPESLRKTNRAGEHDQFSEYCLQGKLSYLAAARIEPSVEPDVPNDLLARLGERFELCAYGLREIRREWESTEDAEGLWQ